MNKSRFLEFVREYVLKMFTGSEIIGEEPSSPRETLVAQGDAGAVKLKFSKTDDYRIIVKRAQPFKNFEMHLIRSIIEEMRKVIALSVSDEYRHGIENLIIEKAICRSLSSSSSKTLSMLLTEISYWGQRTYEGRHTSIGFIVTRKNMGKNTNPNLHISKFLQKDFSALLSDGLDSFIELSADGYISNYIYSTKQVDSNLYAPYSYLKIANLSVGSRIGVCLNEEGETLIFKDKSLLFAKRSGRWICFTHDEIVSKLSEHAGEYEDVRRAIYLSALDTSFNRFGGCIVHINNGDSINVLKHIDEADVLSKESYDIIQQNKINESFFVSALSSQDEIQDFEKFVTEEKCVKTATLTKLISGKKFQDLDRKLRQELIAIDGATVIDYDGTILAVGAIIKIEAGSSGGGRLAAAKTLSNYGISIKISNDGSMQGFKIDKNKLRAKTVFVI
jgi:predicted transcriptional regulator